MQFRGDEHKRQSHQTPSLFLAAAIYGPGFRHGQSFATVTDCYRLGLLLQATA